jgi:phage tail tape-measure protein
MRVMSSNKKRKSTSGKASNRRIAHEAEGGASGALAGAVLGAGAGPVGIVAGTVIGGVAGALAGAAMDTESSRQAARLRELDGEIGVSEGELGAPNLEHPTATVGAYSAQSAGVGLSSSDEQPAEGPIQPPDT